MGVVVVVVLVLVVVVVVVFLFFAPVVVLVVLVAPDAAVLPIEFARSRVPSSGRALPFYGGAVV